MSLRDKVEAQSDGTQGKVEVTAGRNCKFLSKTMAQSKLPLKMVVLLECSVILERAVIDCT